MNLYEVMSELYGAHFQPYGEPPEWARDWDLVAAESHSQARYTAWQHNNPGLSSGCYLDESPRMFCRLVARGVDLERGIYTKEERWQLAAARMPDWNPEARVGAGGQ